MTDIKSQFDPMFYPDSVAVVGASPNIYKWGNFLLSGMLRAGYKGEVYPVNPREDKIYGKKCYKSVLDIPVDIDLAIVVVPVALCLDVIRECIKKKVGGIVLITAGFSETGQQGKAIEEQVAKEVKASGIRMIGPNTMGLINTQHDLAFTASQVRPPRGHISMISQSGNLGDQVMQWAENMGIGINKFIGTGNEADASLTDMIRYLHADESTKIILVYFEGIGDGREFLETVSKVSLEKPVIALKGGRTEAGSSAAQSHTGSLAGSYEVTRGAMEQAGVIIADHPTDLIDFSVAFEYLPLPKGNRVGIVTLGGGWGVVCSDQCNEHGFVLPKLPEKVITEMDKLLPKYWSRGNPIDLVGTFGARLYGTAADLMLGSDNFDALISLGGVGSSHFIIRLVSTARDIDASFDSNMVQMAISEAAKLETRQRRGLADAMVKHQKPIIAVSHAEKLNYAVPIDENMLVAYPTPEKAIRVLQRMLWRRNWLEKRRRGNSAE